MAKIQINNPRQIINGGAKKYYFKVKGLGGPKGDKGDKGDTGIRGPQGEPGNAATVYVGSTTTLEVGQDATVENVGTQYNAVLNFGIPQGPRGPQGIQGERGEPGQTGQTGPRGPQGEKGTNATVYVGTTTTTNPGTQARVYNSGTDSNAVLNFEIPRGDVGPSVPLVQETGYSTTKAMSQNATTEALNGKQNNLTAGSNIQIAPDGKTISATDTTYTAGTGLTLTGTEFSADTTVLATQAGLTTALAPKLEAEVVAELPTTGEEGKLYLTPKDYTTGTASGNPIEATVTEQAGQLESFQLDGDTYQQTYTGKNLWGGFLSDFSRTSQGVSYTNKADGTILANGTSSGNALSLLSSDATSNGRIITLQAGDYVLSGGTSTVLLQVVSSSGEEIAETASDGVKAFTLSVATDIFVRARMTRDTVADNVAIKPMLEAGSTATDYEPFVGGQPSPNPDYPQNIQVVTGKQTVKVLGKNLLNITSRIREVTNAGLRITIANDGKITIDGTATGAIWPDFIWGIQNNTGSHNSCKYYFPKALEAVTYSIKIVNGTVTGSPSVSVLFNDDGGKNASIRLGQPQVKTATDVNGINRVFLTGVQSGTIFNNFQFYLQIESGTTATEVVPYSSTDYPINLGSIELCKLGTYQDYIYKDGENWKIHKSIKKFAPTGEESYSFFEGMTRFSVSDVKTGQTAGIISTHFIREYANNIGKCYVSTNSLIAMGIPNISTEAQAEAWVSANRPEFYCELSIPTDTTITDTNLIAQLEAIRTASLENGTNTITNTATGTNLAGDMEIGYYGYNPRNRYDKWLWLDINNNYEQIGG